MMHDLSDACMLKVEDVSMQFGGVLAVNSLDIEVPKDRIVALIGERRRKDNSLQLYKRSI